MCLIDGRDRRHAIFAYGVDRSQPQRAILRVAHIATFQLIGDVIHRARRVYRVFGRAESQLSEALRGLVGDVAGASLHYQVKFPETLIKVVVADREAAQAAAGLATLDAAVRARIGRWIYGVGDAALPAVTAAALAARGHTVAVAESCTGGMLGQLLTDGAGASAFFLGGAIVYANAEKIRALGVAAALLAEHGAVSEACVCAMADGVPVTPAGLAAKTGCRERPANYLEPVEKYYKFFSSLRPPARLLVSGIWTLPSITQGGRVEVIQTAGAFGSPGLNRAHGAGAACVYGKDASVYGQPQLRLSKFAHLFGHRPDGTLGYHEGSICDIDSYPAALDEIAQAIISSGNPG